MCCWENLSLSEKVDLRRGEKTKSIEREIYNKRERKNPLDWIFKPMFNFFLFSRCVISLESYTVHCALFSVNQTCFDFDSKLFLFVVCLFYPSHKHLNTSIFDCTTTIFDGIYFALWHRLYTYIYEKRRDREVKAYGKRLWVKKWKRSICYAFQFGFFGNTVFLFSSIHVHVYASCVCVKKAWIFSHCVENSMSVLVVCSVICGE